MSVVVDAAEGEDETGQSHGPFSGDRIEIDERKLARVSPGAWVSRLTSRLNNRLNSLIWGN